MQITRPNDIASLIRHSRIAKGLSQEELAERIGLSRKWVYELEGGNMTPTVGTLLRAFTELGIALHAYGPDEELAATIAPERKPQESINIDIDAIADMGLDTIEDNAAETPRPRRKKKPRQ